MKKGTHWKQQERKILRRKGTNMGEIQRENVQINELPPEGSYVIVNQLRTYERGKGEEKIRTVYACSSAYYDAWNFPRIFRVDRYTLGRENALDKRNDAVLVCETPNGGSFEKRLKTCQVAIGVYMLEVVDKNQKLYDGKSARDRSYSDYTVVRRNRYGSKGKKLSEFDTEENINGICDGCGEDDSVRPCLNEPGVQELLDTKSDDFDEIDDGLDMTDEELAEMALNDDIDAIGDIDSESLEEVDDSYLGDDYIGEMYDKNKYD